MHEVGHCFEHALSIRKMRGFKDVFGCWNVPTKPFPTKDKRLLQDYLSVVGDGYGSKHPLEDFAETFAYYCLKIPSFGLTKMQRRKLRFVERQVKAAKLRSLETKPRYFYDGSAQRVSRTLRQLL
jgi:hypothetical protein